MNRKTIKLYNVIFPLWILMFVPPLLFIPLIGNLLIDGLIVYTVLRICKARLPRKLYMSSVLKVWGLGFLSDIIGAVLLYLLHEIFYELDLYDIWRSPITVVCYIGVIIIVGTLICIFNVRVYKKLGLEKKVYSKIALTMGIVTAPWMFLIPTSVFYY